LDGYRSTDQLLVLDWSAAASSGLIGGAGENYIIPVATWAATALGTYGLSSAELNLAGHSWGAYVATELAERMPAIEGASGGLVNTILALDPAADYPGGSYNPTATNEVNFSRNSNFSWAFFATGGTYGSAATAKTADEAFVITGSDHSKLVNVVANLISISYTSPSNPVASLFTLDRLLSWQINSLWRANAYDSSGKRSSTGTFEAVIGTTNTGVAVASLRYFNGTSEVTYFA
jgi:pimeloyl-ACP methyl ester carboxylesterase